MSSTTSSSDEEPNPRPLIIRPLSIQCGGHGLEGGDPILKKEDGTLLKPLQPPPNGPREAKFYQDINQSNHPTDQMMKDIIPKFYGLESIKDATTGTADYLHLQDVTEGFELPTVMDVKVGRQTWDPNASEKKILADSKRYAGTKGPFGFSICGLTVHALDPENPVQVEKYDKSFGRNLKTQDVGMVPHVFFARTQPPVPLIQVIIDKLSAIRDVYDAQRKYKIYSSSLLLSYDAGAVRKFMENHEENELKKSVNICLIDFAHVHDANGERDDNFLHGLDNLIDLFKSFLNKLQCN